MYNPDDLDEQSWENFQPDPNQQVPSQKMREHIESVVGRPPVRRLRYTWIAAASVIILVAIGGLRFWRSEKKPGIVAMAPVLKSALVVTKTILNNTAETKLFMLSDGSKVRLSAGSSIAFDSGFAGPRRDIALTGAGTFTVARDKAKPFTVHTKDIAVTALGTVFGVDDTHNGFTTVLLYSGKVVVKDQAAPGRSFADVYLSPGQQLTVGKADLSVRIKTLTQPKDPAQSTPAVPHQLMTFTRQPLADIFKELQGIYHITITYDADDVKNMGFTGTFNSEKETLEAFLSTICDLNDLTLKKTKGNGFSIQTTH
jgi:ferric-dicitrate binding protein FerR (iron transport regulator)